MTPAEITDFQALIWKTFGKTLDELTWVELDKLQAMMISRMDQEAALLRDAEAELQRRRQA